MKLRQVDLNLLNVFDAVMQYRSVTRAAEHLCLTPSAVSHALARLRHVLKDELFQRDETGMQPTPRALALAEPVRGSLALLEQALTATPFAPQHSIRTFRLAAGDYACALILPRLLQLFAVAAPQVDLKIVPNNRIDIARQLGTGMIEAVIGWFDTIPDDLRRRRLLRESGVMLVRQGHALTTGELTPERLFEVPHVVVDLIGTETPRGGFLNDDGLMRRVWMQRVVLQAHGLTARVAVAVPHFSAVPPLLRASDMVGLLPRRLAARAVAEGGLVMLDPPLDPGSANVEVVWRAQDSGDAGLAWLLDQVARACAEIEEAGPDG
jgi:DNA-binding transcriptional LysR family regulator